MTWTFSLSAECGSEQSAAENFSKYFENIPLVLSNRVQCQCYATIFQDIDENWWCRVCPNNVSEIGIEAPESAYLMTELGILLYEYLRSAPTFRYALVGVEVDEFRTYSELLDESPNLNFPGLVLSNTIYRLIGSPSTFNKNFSTGYVWQPYKGEIYSPLMSSPVLTEKMNRLLKGSVRILIIDNSIVHSKAILHSFKSQGYQADIVLNDKEAIEILNRQHYNLILLDIEMPNINGYELCKQLKSLNNEIHENHPPVILMTTKSSNLDKISNYPNTKITEYPKKPISLDELVPKPGDKIEELLSATRRYTKPGC